MKVIEVQIDHILWPNPYESQSKHVEKSSQRHQLRAGLGPQGPWGPGTPHAANASVNSSLHALTGFHKGLAIKCDLFELQFLSF